MSLRRRPRARLTGVLLTMLVLAGCGPSLREQAAIQQIATNVRYGGSTPSPSAAAPTAVPPASNPFSGYPPLITAPAPLVSGVPAVTLTTPAPCPVAGPLQGPVSAATTTVTGAPAAATYTFRDSGTQTVTDPNTHKVTTATVSPTSSVQVTKVKRDPTTGAWTFTLTDTGTGGTASTDFSVQNGNQTPILPAQGPSPAPSGASTGMVEVTGLSQTDSGGTSGSSFSSPNGLELLPLPAAAGESWTSDPTDPSVANGGPQSWSVSGNTGAVDSQKNVVPGSERISVDACGTVLQGWQVTLSGTITAPQENLTIDATYVIGTQYGGIPLQSHVHRKGTVNGQQYDYNVTEVISQQPGPVSSS